MTSKFFGRFALPTGRGSVSVIALLLITSAALRVLTGAGSALAQDGAQPTLSQAAENDSTLETPVAATAAPRPIAALATRGEMASLIEALQQREAEVAAREKKLDLRQQALAVADQEISKRMEALTETEAALRATLALADEASENDLARLTSVYENMKPKQAAALFEEMEPAFAAGFLGRMTPTIAAEVMAGLSPQVAYTVSVILAGRNANVPKN